MREIFVKVKLTNYGDLEALARGFIKPEEVRSLKPQGKLDTGATRVVITRKEFETLGLREVGKVDVTYANGGLEKQPLSSVIEVEINGRRAHTVATVHEKGRVLIGNQVIEAMDFRIDPVTGELLPRHPEFEGPVEIIE